MSTATQAQLVPLGDRVVLQKENPEEKTSGGILLPDSAQKDKPQQGTIVSVGPGKKDDNGKLQPIDNLAKGDKVIYPRYSGTEIKIDGEEFLILNAGDILAKIN